MARMKDMIWSLPPAQKVAALLGHEFWTRLDEMAAEFADYGFQVDEITDEYIAVVDEETDAEIVCYLGKANNTIWIERTKVWG